MGTPTISTEDHAKGWKTAREKTASEPSTLDFSHYICAAYDDALAEMDATLREVPLQYGFAPDEWNPMTDCSIPKKEDSLRAEEMRTIVLMDAAYNRNNKWYGREFMKHNEPLGTIPEEQSGSTKRKGSAEVALKKVLAMDLLRQFRRAGFLCSNDAIQCYDRILHNVAMLCMLRLGAAKTALTSLFGQLQQAEHSIMTGHGLSKPMYGATTRQQQGLLPVQGVMQGNGMGPIIWLAISVVLLSIMHAQGFYTLFVGAMSMQQVAMCGFTFVDDCDLLIAPEDVETRAEDFLETFQEAVDMWEGCLRVTGGGIKPKKSFWYLIDHVWDPKTNRWRYATAEDCPGEITIRKPGEEDRVPLERLEPHEAKETLGVWMAMDGNQQEQIKKLREKCVAFANRVRAAGGLERNDVWEAMVTQMISALQYAAPATQLTQQEWKKVCAPMLAGALPRAGIARTFPQDVLFGPTKFQGMGLIHPFHFQELEHLELILRHCMEDSVLGQQMQLSWEALTLEVGMPGHMTSWDYTKLHACATDCWLKTVWLYCQKEHIAIEDPFPKLKLAREGDEFIMQAFIDHPKVKDSDLRILNQCRTFLHAVTKADLATADGKRIVPGFLRGQRQPQRGHTYTWPRQPESLSKHHWDTWEKAIKDCFVDPYSRTNALATPMTHWHEGICTQWTWHHWQAENKLYQKEGNHWNVFAAQGRSQRTGGNYSMQDEPVTELPRQCRPACVTMHANSPFMTTLDSFSTHRKEPRDNAEPHRHPGTHEMFKTRMPDNTTHAGWAVEDVRQRRKHADNGRNVAEAMINGTCRAVCDGSYKEGHGTASFCLHGNNVRQQIQGSNRTPG